MPNQQPSIDKDYELHLEMDKVVIGRVKAAPLSGARRNRGEKAAAVNPREMLDSVAHPAGSSSCMDNEVFFCDSFWFPNHSVRSTTENGAGNYRGNLGRREKV